jgi:2-oxoglutarate dehydrogenase E1 component
MSDESVYSSFGSNAGYLAELYQLFKEDPSLVGPEWADFFHRSGFNGSNSSVPNNGSNGAAHANGAHAQVASKTKVVESSNTSADAIADKAIDAFRRWGHLAAQLSPIDAGGVSARRSSEIEADSYIVGKSPAELTLKGRTFAGKSVGSINELITALQSVYCETIGFEFEHITSPEERAWLRDRVERSLNAGSYFSAAESKNFLGMLIKAGLLESELHRKYVGSKWFSLDGNDSLMPAIEVLLSGCARSGVKEVIFGMAHRGRMNILVNVFGMPLEQLFAEFEDRSVATVVGAGDVKYHLGMKGEYSHESGAVQLELLPNPSHLEFVNPVVSGVARAKQDSLYNGDRRAVLGLLLHGDAAFAGQGTVFECLNYAGLDGYSTGGTFHIVINNQIGFTTTPDEARSTRYCTDLAKGLDIPVFHVNNEDPEAACWITQLALDYRNTFGKDVIIDLIGHRKYGHNEGDDPSFTQPLTYSELKSKRQLWQQYGEKLVAAGAIDQSFIDESVNSFKNRFSEASEKVRAGCEGEACSIHGKLQPKPVETAVSEERLKELARGLVAFPESFVTHPKLAKILQKRVQNVEAGKDIEWGVAEALAFGSLVQDGVPVRLSGQDCRRGTFSHRHLVLDHYEKPEIWSPLGELSRKLTNGSRFEVHNSSLSESAVMGFEFGYAANEPKGLTMWEAQFGDFSNGAQCIIDQFIVSSEAKWGQLSGVTLLLPHGFEGQGPEHSSARLERYLQLSADNNISVCYPTNAAQIFHLLRRQGSRDLKRPLVVMTPKSLLRLPAAMSLIDDLSSGGFKRVIVEEPVAKNAKSLVLLSGKVYYDVAAGIKEAGVDKSVALARIEELHPLPDQEITELFSRSKFSKTIWVQEEPQNQGAWSYIAPRLKDLTGMSPEYVGRQAAGETATGSAKHHAKQQKGIISDLISKIQS